jgi:hypothetical protein
VRGAAAFVGVPGVSTVAVRVAAASGFEPYGYFVLLRRGHKSSRDATMTAYLRKR